VVIRRDAAVRVLSGSIGVGGRKADTSE